MQHPIVSIIIPVYNGGAYIRPCIDSILHQTCEDWELLLIDDGSTDDSGKICDEYTTDPRIRVMHKSNAGPAAARNDGIKLARGQFISFVDCDDWIEPDMYQTMLSKMQDNQAEIIICGYIEEYTGLQKEIHNDGTEEIYPAEEALKMVLTGQIGSYLWSMLFRKEVVKEMMPNLSTYEDHATIFKWVSHAHRVVVFNHAFYHYRQIRGSSLHSSNPEKGNHFLQAIKERYHYIADKKLLPGWEQQNRRLYLRGCIKLAKDMARMPQYDERHKAIIMKVREELQSFSPISRQEIGTKNYIRLNLLIADVDLFVRILRFTSSFSLSQRKKDKNMYY